MPARRVSARRDEGQMDNFRWQLGLTEPPPQARRHLRRQQETWLEEYFPEDADDGDSPTTAASSRCSASTTKACSRANRCFYRTTSPPTVIRAHHRLHVQPARQWLEDPHHRHGDPSSLNLSSPPPFGRHNRFTDQVPGFLDVVVNNSACYPALSAARHRLLLLGRDHAAHPELHQRHRLRQADTPSSSRWTQPSPTAPKASAAGTGPATTRAAPDGGGRSATSRLRRHWPLPSCWGRVPYIIRFVTSSICRKISPAPSIPTDYPDRSSRLAVHPRQAHHLQLPPIPVADSSSRLSPPQPRQHARARLQEKGNINTPLELAINNNIDRFSLAMDAIDRCPACRRSAATRRALPHRRIECRNYAHEHGIDDQNPPPGSGRTKSRNLGCWVGEIWVEAIR